MSEVQNLFKHIDLETGICKIGKLELQIRDLSVAEVEELQDREAEINSLPNDLSPKEILQRAREWQDYILKLAFGEKTNISNIKTQVTGAEFKQLIAEVFAFLGNFSGPSGVPESMITSTVKKI